MNVESSRRIRVATIGGGTGSSVLLTGLNEHADRLHISAIVTTFDDGGSSGKLRKQFGVPALGDIRRCIAALLPRSRDRQDLRERFEFRFEHATNLEGDAYGNLLLLYGNPTTRELERSHQRAIIRVAPKRPRNSCKRRTFKPLRQAQRRNHPQWGNNH